MLTEDLFSYRVKTTDEECDYLLKEEVINLKSESSFDKNIMKDCIKNPNRDIFRHSHDNYTGLEHILDRIKDE